MLRATLALAALIGVLLPATAAAQGPLARFERLTIADGLPNPTVYAVAQDQLGLLWVATAEGLSRYDGYGFVTFTHSPADPGSIADSYVRALHVDRSGRLWAATADGLSRFEPAGARFVSYRHNPADPHSLSSNATSSIAEDAAGQLWVGTAAGDLNRLDPASGRFVAYRPAPDAAGGLLYADRGGQIWAGNSAGLFRFDPGADAFTPVPFDPQDAERDVYAIHQGRAGAIWVGTLAGLFQLDTTGRLIAHYRHDPADPRSLSEDRVFVLHEAPDGTLWVGTRASGLDRYDPMTGGFEHYRHDPASPTSLAHDAIQALFEDRAGLLWVGTRRNGLSMFNPATLGFRHYEPDTAQVGMLPQRDVGAVLEGRDGAIWMGGRQGNGLVALDRASGRLSRFQHDPADPQSLPANTVLAIAEGGDGRLWVGTGEEGLAALDPPGGRLSRYRHDPADPAGLSSDVIYALLVGTDGTLWAGTEDGLSARAPDTGRFRVYRHDPADPRSLGNSEVSALFMDRAGALWVGTWGGGLNRLEADGGFTRFQQAADGTGLGDNRVYAIDQDSQGGLWVATPVGLSRLDPRTGAVTSYGEADGLPGPSAVCVLVDSQGLVWASTSRGLARLDPRSGAIATFTARDGLQGDLFNGGACARTRSGELLFGGTNGLTAFDPAAVGPASYAPPVALTAITSLGQPLAPGADIARLERLEIGHAVRAVSFHFAAFDYADPSRIRYAYLLEGFDTGWVAADDQRQATYTNLPGGRYVFRVRAAGPGGVWSEAPAGLRLTVATPPWRSWWAYSLYALAAAALVGGAARAVTQERANHVLAAEVAERRRAEQENARLRQQVAQAALREERSRLARELHDSVTQSLYSLGLLAQSWRLTAQAEGDSEAERQYDQVVTISHQALVEMRLLISQLRPPELEAEGLAGAVQRRLDAVERRVGIQAWVEGPHELDLPLTTAEQLYRIVQEALNNALKHAAASAVTVSFQSVEGGYAVAVSDNGRGFVSSATTEGFGMASMRERAAQLGAELRVDSTPGAGTTVRVRGPVEKEGLWTR